MLVSFNPSLITPSVNRKNPDRTSFQRVSSAVVEGLVNKPSVTSSDAERLGTFLAQGGKVTRTQLEKFFEKARGAAKGILDDLASEHSGNIIPA